MYVDTGDLTSQLRELEERLALDVAVHALSRRVRWLIGAVFVLVTIGVTLVALSFISAAHGRALIKQITIRTDRKVTQIMRGEGENGKGRLAAQQQAVPLVPTPEKRASSADRARAGFAGTSRERASGTRHHSWGSRTACHLDACRWTPRRSDHRTSTYPSR